MTDQPAPRPPSPWARFTRPAPGEQRVRGEVQPPPPRHATPWLDGASGAGVLPAPPAGPSSSGQPATAGPTVGAASVWAPYGTPAAGASASPVPVGPAPADASAWPAAAPTTAGPSAGSGSYFDPGPDDDWAVPRQVDADPGRGLAVASVVFGVFAAPLGLVFALVALARARAAGASRTLARVGVAVSSVVLVVGLVSGVAALDYAARLSSACAQLGPGEYVDAQGRGVTCD